MLTDDTTAFLRRLRNDFHNNPVGRRVWLPDGSLAVVKQFIDDDGQRLHRVVGITPTGRLCKLPPGTPRWHSIDDLKLVYYTASINPEYLRS